MVKMIRVSDEFHEIIQAHKNDDETMEQTLRRMMGGPDPAVLAEIIGSDEDTSNDVREAIERRRERGRIRREELRDLFG